MRHLKPKIVMTRQVGPVTIVTNPHGKPPRSALTSIAKIIVWLMEEWCSFLFQEPKKTLLICDRYYHDLLVDPQRYRYGAPMWIARLIGNLMPQPELWVLLDAPSEILQSRKQEVSAEESARQRQAYSAFARAQRSHVIVDASQSLNKVVEDVGHAITGMMIAGNRE
jgi:thymidylate kinase